MRNPKRIISGVQLGTAISTLYTAPANQKCILRRLTFINTTGAAATIDVHLVPSGGTFGVTNQLVDGVVISAGETWSCPDAEGHVLEAGGTIQALSDTASAITVIGSGVEAA